MNPYSYYKPQPVRQRRRRILKIVKAAAVVALIVIYFAWAHPGFSLMLDVIMGAL